MIGPDEYDRQTATTGKTPLPGYMRYQAKLRENNAFDFDDLIMYTVLLAITQVLAW